MAAVATKKYEDFDPSTEIVSEKDCDTILVHIPGFRKENLRVQLTVTNFVRISGERETEGKYIRFQKQVRITPNTDTNKISAKFEKGLLSVRLPKLIIPAEDKPDKKILPVPQPPKPEAPAGKPQPRTNVQQKTAERTSQNDGPKKAKNEAAVQDVSQKTTAKDEPKAKNETSTKTSDSTSLGQKSEERKGENNAARAGEGSNENVDGVGKSKSRLENYQRTVVDRTSQPKMSRRTFYVALVTLAAVGVGLYVTNFIRSYRTSEISV